MSNIVNTGIVNEFTVTPRNLAQYTAYRGVTDFTQVGQFQQYESGHQFLAVLQMPTFMVKLGEEESKIKSLVDSFKHMLEFEFRGLDGLPDTTAETYEITDGINTQNFINRVTRDTSITVSSAYFERQGSLITKFSELYLTGIKDPMSQAKTYHGLIKNDKLDPGIENEIFTMMYFVTDDTMLRLEKAYLLCNMQLTKAESSMYNGNKSDINNKELTIEWNCFPVTGYLVDKAAKKLLEDITGVSVTADYNSSAGVSEITYKNNNPGEEGTNGYAALDSAGYRYGILNKSDSTGTAINELIDALG